MSGVKVGSRLDRLVELRDRLDKEIAVERDVEKRRARLVAERRAAAEAAERQARRDSVSAHTVRAWAMTYGHDYPQRGRVPDSLIDLYLDAHPELQALRQGRAPAVHPRGCTCQPCLDTADDLREERQITERIEAS